MSQTLVNQLWQLELNYPDTVEWNASILDGSNLITTGNTWNGATQKTNIVTTKTNQGGSIVWQTEYNGTASGFDYGAALIKDASGNVFVAGATNASDDYTYDIVVIKYNSIGVQQWATTFDGTGAGNDIPSDILLIGTDIYVCAASIGITTGYDNLLLKLNSGGTVQWNKRYDYTSLYDIPGHLISNGGTNIVVSGASQSSATNWDYTSLKYSSSGTLIQTQRSSAAGYGFDRPTGLVTDGSDNFYITGYTYNGTDYDMRTIKLDEDLSPVWTVSENDGGEDGSNAICIDGSDNIYIAGYAENSIDSRQIKIVKYNSGGTLQWEKILQNSSNDIEAQATGITYNSTSDRVVITGFYEYTSGKKVITTFALRTDNGNLTWKNEYPNLGESIDIPTNVLANNNYVWVYGRRTEDDTTRYVTVKYETMTYPYEIINDTSGKPIYVDEQMIISFKPENVDLNFVNNTQKQFSNLIDVIDSGTYNTLYPLIKGQGQFTPKVYKIYSKLTANDSLSITRLGDTISIPKFWSSFIVTLNVNIEDVYDTLNNMISIIDYSHPNYLFGQDFSPNDDDYNLQNSLFDGSTSLEDINTEGAWDVEKGGTHIKVGVFDTGIYWKHEDFHLTSGNEEFSDSKIIGGWDYENDHAVYEDDNSLSNSNNHGTCVAGIIGAITDNDIGIAGIAGGDLITGDINSTGVQLFDMEVAREEYNPLIEHEEPLYDTWFCANAITEGASYTPDGSYGYGLHIMNHSWGTGIVGQIIDWNFDAMSNAMNFAFKSHVIQVCAKGNEATGDLHYPSDLSDNYILSVGGSGNDGEFYEGSSGSGSNFGNNIDLMAPYGSEGVTIYTTDNGATDDYITFGGTSGSAPHVSGVAALMLSQVNNHDSAPHFENLTQEDVEAILQITADERFEPPCNEDIYDDYCGWGILDAQEALEVIEMPKYKVIHICQEYNVTDDDLDEEEMTIFIAEAGDYVGISAGYYCAARYKINRAAYHSLSASSVILNNWILPSMSNVLGLNDAVQIVTDDPSFTMSSPSLSSTTVEGYIYFLYHTSSCELYGSTVNKWIPFDPNTTKAKFCYSLHVYDEYATEITALGEEVSITIFPNPTSDFVNIASEDFIGMNDLIIQVKDITGKILYSSKEDRFSISNNFISIPVAKYQSGIYIISVNDGYKQLTGKFIKL
ncbi:MAG: S8 family serine peptidase [Bacteroidetes bacterium]|nr:S8 family serine peptidase [Bacteroidota bacterium]